MSGVSGADLYRELIGQEYEVRDDWRNDHRSLYWVMSHGWRNVVLQLCTPQGWPALELSRTGGLRDMLLGFPVIAGPAYDRPLLTDDPLAAARRVRLVARSLTLAELASEPG